MNEQSNEQLQAQLVSLKARLFDANEQVQLLTSALSQVAQKVNYEGEDLKGLLEAIPSVKKED